jgi:uncharacterized protein with ATP-grasp and redox domains
MKPPPQISTADPHSFARHTIEVRKPGILAGVLAARALPAAAVGRLERLRENIGHGTVSDSFAACPYDPSLFAAAELAAWRAAIAAQAGHSWLDLPWYFAESYFYVSLLLALGYYDPQSATCGRDPFASPKLRELSGPGGGIELAAGVLDLLESRRGAADSLKALLRFCLWGNRVDLSNAGIAERHRSQILAADSPEDSNLLRDDTPQLVEALLSARRVDIVLDNCGPELVCDLLLALTLLDVVGVERVVLHVKQAPFFVSDAMAADVEKSVATLASSPAAAVRRAGGGLQALRAEGRLALADHYFWNGPRHFPDLPAELRSELGKADLVILKGDANYRRLLSDRRWPHTARMEEIAAYFPAPLACLRTLKSELAVDLTVEQVAALDAEDPDWLINGRRGIIRCLPRRTPGPAQSP